MKRENERLGGFTLMEATVALAVFTIGMLGLGGAFSQIVHANAVARQKQIAVALAERKLAEFRLVGAADWRQTRGTFGAPFEDYTWEAWFRTQAQDLGIVDVGVAVTHRSGASVWLWSQMVVPDEQE
jgi:Tfp pilus assembly protein PilV